MVKQRLTGVVLVVVGLGILGAGFIGPFGTYQDVQSHETVEAEILSTGIESAEEVDEGVTELEYYPRVEYEYTIDGTSYTATRIYHPSAVNTDPGELEGKEFDERNNAEDVVNDYPQGETTTAYYDPEDPEFSYLRDPVSDIYITLGTIGLFGVLMTGLGLGGIAGKISLTD